MSFVDAILRLFSPSHVPAGFPAVLEEDERVVAVAALADGGHLVLTPVGLWVPEVDGSVRRVGWHLVSRATWEESSLLLTESVVTGNAGGAVLLDDLSPRRFTLTRPGRVPREIRDRVGKSVRSSHHVALAGGGAYFVQRKVPGQDGFVLQVRPDPGTPPEEVRRVASRVVARLPMLASPG